MICQANRKVFGGVFLPKGQKRVAGDLALVRVIIVCIARGEGFCGVLKVFWEIICGKDLFFLINCVILHSKLCPQISTRVRFGD
jgi:hypothetical protein